MNQTRESLANDSWRACDILRRDNNCGGGMEYIEHLAWLYRPLAAPRDGTSRPTFRSPPTPWATIPATKNGTRCSRWN